MKLIELTPRPHEAAVARVPAGMGVRAVRENGDVRELPAYEEDRYIAVPGGGLPWGATWSIWYQASRMTRYRHPRDRATWQQAARLLEGSRLAPRGEPAVLHVVYEEQQVHGRTVWAAVRIRHEGEQ
jgi:hypothetical protein